MTDEPVADRRTVLQAAGVACAGATVTTTVSAETGEALTRLNLGTSNAASMSTAQSTVQNVTPASAELYKRSDALGFISVDVPSDTAEELRVAFAERDDFRYAEYDRQLHAFETPDDELFDDQYAPQQVRAPDAYEKTEGSEDVTIAVIDQGVKYDHPDLADQFGSLKGKDFVDGDDDPFPESMSDESHGTHVAGIASATTDNGTGVAGISNSRLLSARALGSNGGGSLADIADAITWAADQGADVINMSLGGGGYTDTMKNAVSYAVDNGALPVCAAGNDGSGSVSYPAAFEECVAVTAVDSNEEFASFSQYGEKADVTAPGVDVVSTWTEYQSKYDGKYQDLPGTSMACPVAAGVAALGLAVDDYLEVNELRARLKNTAVDVGLSDQKQGAGRVDALNMVGDVPPPILNAAFSVSSSAPEAEEVVVFDASDSEGSIAAYEWNLGDGTTATGEVVEHAYADAGDYSVTLSVETDDGASDTESETVSVSDPNEGPTASFVVDSSDVAPGEPVTVDASASSDPDGSIATYDWDFGDGTTATGDVAAHEYDDAGEYTISLTVTDDDGAVGTAAATVQVEGGSCESQRSDSVQGSLAGWWDDASFTYTPDFENPCQATFSLEGPASADFDLYVTFDGRTPSTYDYDARSITYGADEQVIVDDVEGDQEFGILVDSYSGSGSFTLTVEEF
jgi:serine protease